MLAALYLARAFDLSPGAAPAAIDVIDGEKLWRLTATGKESEVIKVAAGSYTAIPVKFVSTPLNPSKDKGSFSGLFGMKGNIEIWVEKDTHRIVRIRGTVPLGISLNVDISLTKLQVPETELARPPSPAP
jgi:hypothetical protein